MVYKINYENDIPVLCEVNKEEDLDLFILSDKGLNGRI